MKPFRLPLIINAIALVLVAILGNLQAAVTVLILTVLEVSFSFDNAVVNAKILGKMNAKWQRLFLTVGIIIAVFGMRLLFPLIVVSLAAHISPIHALSMGIHHPDQYSHHLKLAHPDIAAFGGFFLGMLFLNWVIEDREVKWLKPVENFFVKVGKIETATVIIMLIIAAIIGNPAGMLGIIAYLIVSIFDTLFDEDAATAMATAGLGTFIYLEVVDASFSFDSVIGAFAISTNIFMIALGLGIGATYIRTMTVELVKRKALQEFRYLEHGAHWAIGLLAVFMLLGLKYNIPDVITGLIGVILIGLALINSIQANKREKKNGIIRKPQQLVGSRP